MRHLVLALLLASALPGPAVLAEQAPPAPSRTGKERQGGKAFDEQRVNDCRVPQALRTRPRPAECSAGG